LINQFLRGTFSGERKSDPYIILGVASNVYINTTLVEKLPYKINSFTPIANMGADGSVFIVRSDSQFKTANDIIAEAKKRPKELLQGGSSFTAFGSMMGQSIQKLKGVQWSFVSFKSEAEALLNVLSGNVHFASTSPDVALDYVRTGKVRVLFSNSVNRYPQYKDIPTIKEVGLGDAVGTYRGVVGPPNMPAYAVKKLEAVFKKVMDNDRFKKFMADSMTLPAWMPSHEYGKLLEEENERLRVRLAELDLLKK
jgi:putative tricarboxylic transport membrane protein